MILIIPIIAYIVIVIILIFITNKIFKNRETIKRKQIRKRILVLSSIIFPILGFLYFLVLFGIALDDHFDVKKGTFLWYATMDNETITEFPILEPVGKVTYNKIGGDGPSIAAGWEVEYNSYKDVKFISSTIFLYLKLEGYEIVETKEPYSNCTGIYKKNNNTQLYSGANDVEECLDLLIQRNDNGTTRIECIIVY